jgi:hypothetical protein
MPNDPIREALEAAACALCREAQSCHGDCSGKCAWRDGEVDMPACAAAAVAAFLRVIARQHVEDCDRDGVPGDPMGVGAWLDDIAAAVEAAGRE